MRGQAQRLGGPGVAVRSCGVGERTAFRRRLLSRSPGIGSPGGLVSAGRVRADSTHSRVNSAAGSLRVRLPERVSFAGDRRRSWKPGRSRLVACRFGCSPVALGRRGVSTPCRTLRGKAAFRWRVLFRSPWIGSPGGLGQGRRRSRYLLAEGDGVGIVLP